MISVNPMATCTTLMFRSIWRAHWQRNECEERWADFVDSGVGTAAKEVDRTTAPFDDIIRLYDTVDWTFSTSARMIDAQQDIQQQCTGCNSFASPAHSMSALAKASALQKWLMAKEN